ncbi:NUDIX hydrolase [Vibrio rhodolitus]|uniref:NUDIX hydrolase n=1 Tax=Vibrio rhodolitus TaxID=2231649 RepID=UPI001ABF0939|nr:NUDIX hydrolase [Vibrio rhodolitus]
MSEPRVAVIAATYRDNELLLVQRSKEPQKYGWGYPGGSVNAGESLHAAACRELYEETQVQAVAEKTFEVIEVNEFDATGKHHHFILLAVLCRYISGEAIASDDALDCKWMSFEQIQTEKNNLIAHVARIATLAAELLDNE